MKFFFATTVPLVTDNLQELRDRITAAVALIDRDMMTHVWNELDYRLDVCRINIMQGFVMYEKKNL